MIEPVSIAFKMTKYHSKKDTWTSSHIQREQRTSTRSIVASGATVLLSAEPTAESLLK